MKRATFDLGLTVQCNGNICYHITSAKRYLLLQLSKLLAHSNDLISNCGDINLTIDLTSSNVNFQERRIDVDVQPVFNILDLVLRQRFWPIWGQIRGGTNKTVRCCWWWSHDLLAVASMPSCLHMLYRYCTFLCLQDHFVTMLRST